MHVRGLAQGHEGGNTAREKRGKEEVDNHICGRRIKAVLGLKENGGDGSFVDISGSVHTNWFTMHAFMRLSEKLKDWKMRYRNGDL